MQWHYKAQGCFTEHPLVCQGVPEMGYDPFGAPPRGEVCIRGPMVFDSYYNDPEKTKEAMGERSFLPL